MTRHIVAAGGRFAGSKPKPRVPLPPTKVCARCKKERRTGGSRPQFTKHPGNRDGLQCYCKGCVAELRRLRYREQKERLREEPWRKLTRLGLEREVRCLLEAVTVVTKKGRFAGGGLAALRDLAVVMERFGTSPWAEPAPKLKREAPPVDAEAWDEARLPPVNGGAWVTLQGEAP